MALRCLNSGLRCAICGGSRCSAAAPRTLTQFFVLLCCAAVTDGQAGWVHTYQTPLSESGVERLTIEFADQRQGAASSCGCAAGICRLARLAPCLCWHPAGAGSKAARGSCQRASPIAVHDSPVLPPCLRNTSPPPPPPMHCSPSRYGGHGSDRGYNALGFYAASNVWARQASRRARPGRALALLAFPAAQYTRFAQSPDSPGQRVRRCRWRAAQSKAVPAAPHPGPSFPPPQVTVVNCENAVFAHWVDHASLLGGCLHQPWTRCWCKRSCCRASRPAGRSPPPKLGQAGQRRRAALLRAQPMELCLTASPHSTSALGRSKSKHVLIPPHTHTSNPPLRQM
jgi:hypothetical protein